MRDRRREPLVNEPEDGSRSLGWDEAAHRGRPQRCLDCASHEQPGAARRRSRHRVAQHHQRHATRSPAGAHCRHFVQREAGDATGIRRGPRSSPASIPTKRAAYRREKPSLSPRAGPSASESTISTSSKRDALSPTWVKSASSTSDARNSGGAATRPEISSRRPPRPFRTSPTIPTWISDHALAPLGSTRRPGPRPIAGRQVELVDRPEEFSG